MTKLNIKKNVGLSIPGLKDLRTPSSDIRSEFLDAPEQRSTHVEFRGIIDARFLAVEILAPNLKNDLQAVFKGRNSALLSKRFGPKSDPGLN